MGTSFAHSKLNSVILCRHRTDVKVASAYYYDVKDASGNPVNAMSNLKANIADVTQDSMQFATDIISDANQRYSVVVKACTGQGTLCSVGTSSNLAGVGEFPGAFEAHSIVLQAEIV